MDVDIGVNDKDFPCTHSNNLSLVNFHFKKKERTYKAMIV